MWALAMGLIRPVFTFLFGWLRGALPAIATFFGTSITQLLIGMGFSITTFTGFNVLTEKLILAATSGFSGLTGDLAAILGLMWVDKAINMMLSAGVGLMTIKGLKAGTLSRGGFFGSKSGGAS